LRAGYICFLLTADIWLQPAGASFQKWDFFYFMRTFVQFIRGKAAEDLLFRDPNSFIILSVVAQRARRIDDHVSGLKTGEAMIGRTEFSQHRYSISQQNYRSALKRLEKYGFVTTKPTRQGTIVKLLNLDIYDINDTTNQHTEQHTANTRPTHDQHTANTQPTTNKNVNKVNNGKKEKFYNPDHIVSVINTVGKLVEAPLGKILDGIFGRYPGNANTTDRNDVAYFLTEHPDYPFCIAVDREIAQNSAGVPSRNIRNFLNDPPDRSQVMGWFERHRVEEE